MKKKITLYGGGFRHSIDEINKITKYIDWTLEENESEICFYVDSGVMNDVNPLKKNYGWLRESKTIIPNYYLWVKKNITFIKQKFIKVFTHDLELSKTSDVFELVQCDMKSIFDQGEIYPKNKLVSMISSNKNMCEEHMYRLRMVEKFKNKCDLFGKGFNYIENKKDGLRDYCFSITIENATYFNMITEKITDCFMTGTIPIYYGTENVENFFNPDGIIKLDENFDIDNLNFNLYHQKMEAIKDNFEIAKSLMLPEDLIFINFLI